MDIFLDNAALEDLWTKAKETFIAATDYNKIKQMVANELQTVYGEHPTFEFPFSNESLTSKKLVMTNLIKPR